MRARSIFGWLICLSAALTPASCGGSSSDGTASASPVPITEFADRVAAAMCNMIAPCCQQQGLTYDAASCKAGWKQLYEDMFVKPAQNGSLTYDPNAAGICLAWAESQSCQTYDSGTSPDACDQTFQGTKPNGAPCTSSLECQAPPGGRAHCEKSATGSTCVQEPRGKQGDGCDSTCTESGSSISCSGSSGGGTATCYTNDGLYCAGTCQPLIAMGQPCEFEGCVDGAYCASGACAAKLPAGGDCKYASDACAAETYCDFATGKCTALKADGAACEGYDECVGSCNQGKCGPDDSGMVSPASCSGTLSP